LATTTQDPGAGRGGRRRADRPVQRRVFGGARCAPCVVIVERHPDVLIHPLGCARHQPEHGRAVSSGRIGARHPRAASYVSSAIGTRLRADLRRDTSRRGIYAGIDDEEEGITHLTQTLLPVPRRSGRSTRTSWRSFTPGPGAEELGAVTYGLLRS
jgi:hypothetical protein